jgi:ADP-ribosylglycohydrolase
VDVRDIVSGWGVGPGTRGPEVGGAWDAISAAMVAFAAGDAFGVHYEFLQVREAVDAGRLLDRTDWPHGGVSDDTLLSLISIQALDPRDAGRSATEFLRLLRAAVGALRGLGPTTRSALGLPVSEAESGLIGASNGGMMRTALLGLAFPSTHGAARRDQVEALAAATHPHPNARACAVLASALFSDALDRDSQHDSMAVLRREAENWATGIDVSSVVGRVGDWSTPPSGVSLDPVATLAAFVSVADRSATCLQALEGACSLGGDTDTVSALAAGLVAARHPATCGLDDIAWLAEIRWDEIPSAGRAVAKLVDVRAGLEG